MHEIFVKWFALLQQSLQRVLAQVNHLILMTSSSSLWLKTLFKMFRKLFTQFFTKKKHANIAVGNLSFTEVNIVLNLICRVKL